MVDALRIEGHLHAPSPIPSVLTLCGWVDVPYEDEEGWVDCPLCFAVFEHVSKYLRYRDFDPDMRLGK